MAVLDRPRRHVHRRRRARARTARLATHKLLSENPERYADAAVQGIRDLLGPRAGRSRSRRADRRGQDGHDGRHQRAARAQGRARRVLVITRGFARRAAHRLPEPARHSSPATSCCPSCSTTASIEIDERVGARRRRSLRRSTERRARGPAARGVRRRLPGRRDRADARLPLSRSTSSALGRDRARRSASRRSRSVHEVSPLMKLVGARRHHGGRRLPVADPARATSTRSARATLGDGRPAACSCSRNGGLTDARPFQGKDAILSGPAGGIVGAVADARARPGFDRDHRLRHGRHLDRRLALRRRVRARVRHRGRRRAAARADDAHPHRRGRRRLDLPLRRRALPRRPGVRRRQSRARPATGAAGR